MAFLICGGLIFGAFVDAREVGLELGEAVVHGFAKLIDFFGEGDEAGVDFIANDGELGLEFGFGGEIGVVAFAGQEFFGDGRHGENGSGGDQKFFDVTGSGSGKLANHIILDF
jgi:hypothetical protein